MAKTSTSTGWNVLGYEVEMHYDLRETLCSPEFANYSKAVQNAVVESTCLHTRILVDILLSKDSGRGDDVRLDQLLPGFSHTSIQQLQAAYGDSKPIQPHGPSACWILNKMITHPTLKRGTNYDYTQLFNDLLPKIDSVLQAIKSGQPTTTPTVRTQQWTMDPRFCAKTGS